MAIVSRLSQPQNAQTDRLKTLLSTLPAGRSIRSLVSCPDGLFDGFEAHVIFNCSWRCAGWKSARPLETAFVTPGEYDSPCVTRRRVMNGSKHRECEALAYPMSQLSESFALCYK